MRLIDINILESDTKWDEYGDNFISYSQSQIGFTLTVDAVPVDELLKLRNWLYESDGITMGGLRSLNELIAKYSNNPLPRIENGFERRNDERKAD